MAVNPQSIYADLMALRAATQFPFVGPAFSQLAWAIASGVTAWAPQVQFTGIATGTAGVGTINVPTTRVIVPPNPAVAIAGMASAGLSGPLGTALGTLIGQAIPKTISTVGQYTGAVVGCGVGADVSKVVSAPGPSLASILIPFLTGFLGPGPAGARMAQGLGTAISSLMLAGTGVGSVVGTPSPSPGSGPSTSVLV